MTAPEKNHAAPLGGPGARARMRIGAGGLLGLILSAGLLGCGSLTGDFGETERGVREVDLAASPTPGMRLAYRVRITATLSGAGVRGLPESQKSASTSQRYLLEVTEVATDSFGVRIVGDGLGGPVLARFERNWTPLKFGVEREGKYTDEDLPTFPILGEAFQIARDLSGHWIVGQARPWQRSVTIPPMLSVEMRGTVTLRRITRLEGRRAGEFEYVAAGAGDYMGSRIQMKLTGRYWVDLATGFTLAAKTTVPGQFTQAGDPVQMELKDERTVSPPDSMF